MKRKIKAWPKISWRARRSTVLTDGYIVEGHTVHAGKIYGAAQVMAPKQEELSFLPRGCFRHYSMKYIRTLLKRELH